MGLETYLAFGQIISKEKEDYRPITHAELEAIDQGDSWILVLKESMRNLANGPHLLGLSTMNILMSNYHEHFANVVSHNESTKSLFFKPDWIFFQLPKNMG